LTARPLTSFPSLNTSAVSFNEVAAALMSFVEETFIEKG
jgi:hypothetical protein